MTNARKGFVLSAAFVSTIATLLSIASLATEQWVTAQGEFTGPIGNGERLSSIKYGLFTGIIVQRRGPVATYQIKITCWVSKNVCAYICQRSSELRKKELKALYYGENIQFTTSCPGIRREYDIMVNNEHTYISGEGNNRQFLNAALYISTVIFLSISIIFGVIASILLIWNVAGSPIEVYFSFYGIYAYSFMAFSTSVLAIALWGSLFGMYIVENVGILYTIIGQMSTYGRAELGYSYWILLPSCFLHLFSMILLGIRQHLLNEDAEKRNSRYYDTAQAMMIRH